MRGELLPVWADMWTHVWTRVGRAATRLDHPDVFCELYREINSCLAKPRSIEEIADITDDVAQARLEFRRVTAADIVGERQLVAFLESSFETLEELGGDALANVYFVSLARFLVRFSLRYDLRRPCTLCPTVPGVFASLLTELKAITGQDAHLSGLMRDFESAVRDLRIDTTDARIKTCIQRQMNLLETLGARCPNVTQTTLGAMCDQIGSWPHATVRESLKKLYGFASDYPGIRHGGNANGVLRPIDMRDMVAMSILLMGYTPYLVEQMIAKHVYEGAPG